MDLKEHEVRKSLRFSSSQSLQIRAGRGNLKESLRYENYIGPMDLV